MKPQNLTLDFALKNLGKTFKMKLFNGAENFNPTVDYIKIGKIYDLNEPLPDRKNIDDYLYLELINSSGFRFYAYIPHFSNNPFKEFFWGSSNGDFEILEEIL